MDSFRQRYSSQMELPASQTSERFPIMEAKKLHENLRMGIYEDAIAYLTGEESDQRGLSIETLQKYNVGLGTEKFTDSEGCYQGFDSIYFPLYQPRNLGNETGSKTPMIDVAEAEAKLESDLAVLVKMKVRAAYKANKSK